MVNDEKDGFLIIRRYEGGEAGAGGAGDAGASGDPAGAGGAGDAGDTGAPAAAPATPADYRESLPEDLKTNETLAKYKDPVSAFRALVSAQGLIGRNPDDLMEVPSDVNLEALQKVGQRLGVPEKFEDYQMELPKEFLEKIDPKFHEGQMIDLFRQSAHAAGVHPAQAAAVAQPILAMMAETEAQEMAKIEEQDTANEEALKVAWGEAFGQNKAAAEFAINKLGGNELLEVINGSDIATNPALIKALSQAGKLLAEDNTDGAGVNSFNTTLSPDEARAKANELMIRSQAAFDANNVSEGNRLNQESLKFRKMAAR
jgi:hypothetical protein